LSDVWFFDRVAGKNQRHPNEKPLKLINRMIINSSNEGDIVFDGFCGGGSVGESCFKNNRFYCLCEIDKHYYNIAKEKLNSLNNVVEEKNNKLF
jgi:DNA modification methylase